MSTEAHAHQDAKNHMLDAGIEDTIITRSYTGKPCRCIQNERIKKFAEEHNFLFPLISDPERKIGELYGAARPADDPAVAFPLRTSFLISPEGLIAAIWDQDSITDFQTHGDEVLTAIRSQS